MKENYIYPAKMKYEDGMYQIQFIDFPDMILIEEADREEVVRAAQECLALEILDYESRGKGRRYELLYGSERPSQDTYEKKVNAIKAAKEREPELAKKMEYYLAMKVLRNRMNHASEDEISEGEQRAIKFLKEEYIDSGIQIQEESGKIKFDYQKIEKLIIDGLELMS